ncbi:MAG: AraC family transcriptional regulator [Bacteroidetes bacterium]|nr:AraC family transcriptional regulator [Bacteroidota bacterium]
MNEIARTFYLLAALQGVLLSAVLLTKKANHSANRILASATLALSLELIAQVYYFSGWYRHFPGAMGFTYPFPFLYGPLFYLYARLVSKATPGLRRTDALHFLPAILVYASITHVFFYTDAAKIAFVDTMIEGEQDPLYDVIEAAIPVQGIIYTVLTIGVVAAYNRRIRDAFSTIELVNLVWLKYVTLGMIVIWSLVVVLFIIGLFLPFTAGWDALIHIPIGILIYFIGYKGLRQPEIFLDGSTSNPDLCKDAKYERSGLSDRSADEIKDKLLHLMREERLYLDQSLTLQKLAARLDISSHNLSEVINSRLHQSYYDFVNAHRVEEFKSRLADPANAPLNLLSIAFDAGFSSKGTFNAIFKKHTGMTPSWYKARMAREGKNVRIDT